MQNKGGFSHEMFVFFSFYFFRFVLDDLLKYESFTLHIKDLQIGLHISAFYLFILYLTQKSVLSISKQTTNFVKKNQDS